MNASKSLALAFVVGFFVAVPVTSCGPTAAKCDADSCAHGCCDAAGKCQTANSVFQCGQGGHACQVCGATQQCIIGLCTGGSGAGPGGGSGATGGGSNTGGGLGTTGGGAGATGGGSATGGGVGTTGGGTANCATATPLVLSIGNPVTVNGTTVDQGSDITFACDTSLSAGEDVVYSFTVSGSAVAFSANVSFDTDVYGGLAIVSLGQCTSRSSNLSECNSPSQSTNSITATLNPGVWGLVVKTYDDGSQASPGSYSFQATISSTGTGGGIGTTGGGIGTTGGGIGTTGGGVGSTGGGVGSTGGGVGSTGGGIGSTGGGVGSTGGGTGSTGGGTGTWTCNPSYLGDGTCDCGCGILDTDCASAALSSCSYCDDTGSCSTQGCSGNTQIKSSQNWACN